MTLTRNTLAFGTLTVALAVTVACSPATPATPTYAKDVAPILEAHCTRCHSARGADGGFLVDPDAKTTSPTPALCHFDFYDDATMGMGAKACAALVKPYIEQTNTQPMPPAPATKLSDWEIEVIERWGAMNPPPP